MPICLPFSLFIYIYLKGKSTNLPKNCLHFDHCVQHSTKYPLYLHGQLFIGKIKVPSHTYHYVYYKGATMIFSVASVCLCVCLSVSICVSVCLSVSHIFSTCLTAQIFRHACLYTGIAPRESQKLIEYYGDWMFTLHCTGQSSQTP